MTGDERSKVRGAPYTHILGMLVGDLDWDPFECSVEKLLHIAASR
jgi:hypothetical protein